MRLHSEIRDGMAGILAADFGVGFLVEFWTGPPPATLGGSEAGNTLIASITTPNPALTVVAGSGAATKTGTWQAVTVATGQIGHAVVKRSGGAVRGDFTVTDQAGNGDFKVDTLTSTFVGQQLTVTATSILMGAAA